MASDSINEETLQGELLTIQKQRGKYLVCQFDKHELCVRSRSVVIDQTSHHLTAGMSPS